MKALTLTQPWATAVVMGVKKIETRSWSARVPEGGFYFAVHAAKGWETEDRAFALEDAFPWLGLYPEQYPRGAVVGVAKLVRVAPADQVLVSGQEHLFGWFERGRFAWFLEDARPLATPVPCRGAQGWWTVPAEVETEMRRQFGIAPVQG